MDLVVVSTARVTAKVIMVLMAHLHLVMAHLHMDILMGVHLRLDTLITDMARAIMAKAPHRLGILISRHHLDTMIVEVMEVAIHILPRQERLHLLILEMQTVETMAAKVERGSHQLRRLLLMVTEVEAEEDMVIAGTEAEVMVIVAANATVAIMIAAAVETTKTPPFLWVACHTMPLKTN
jgi:hypothetical protein